MGNPLADRALEDATNVASFLSAVQPLDGCDYSRDLRFFHGHQLIRQYAADRLLVKDPPKLKLKDAADVLYVMHNIQPIEGHRIFDGAKVHCGYVAILTWIEQSLRHKGVARG